jgi:uncharacterized phage-associated protein
MTKLIVIPGGLEVRERGTTVHDVADFFLSVVDRDAGSSITHLKLQKLVYYAQAWHLVFTGNPLFPERIEAWVHGPVCPELYKRFADCGYQSLPEPETMPEFTPEQLETLEEVWDVYGDFDGRYLEQLTHQEKPWIEARGGCEPFEHCQNEISLTTMKEFYSLLNANV